MDAPLISIDVTQSTMEANHLMHFNHIRHLGVTEAGTVVGVLSVRDLVRHFLSEKHDGPLAAIADIVKPLTVLIHRNLQTIPAFASIQEAACKMAERQIGSLVVMDTAAETAQPIGLITETDLVRKGLGQSMDPTGTSVGALMTQPIIDIDLSRSIDDAVSLMVTHGVRHLLVSESGKIVGILSVRDFIGMISIRDLPRYFKPQGNDGA